MQVAPGLTSLVLVESIRQLGEEARVERHDYLSARPGATETTLSA